MTIPDRTRQAVHRQMAAMGCSLYEVGIYDRPSGKMLIRPWTPEEVLKSIGWMKRSNAQDSDIYIRPEGSKGLLLVDDLLLGTLAKLKAAGLPPAAVTRTSEDNYQAWIRVSKDPITRPLATQAAKLLAERFGGDPASADWRHFGRLAGFTNRKPERRDEQGKAPFVLLWEVSGVLAPAGAELLKDAGAAGASFSPGGAVFQGPRPTKGQAPAAYYAQVIEGLRERYLGEFDESRADWMAVNRLMSLGYPVEGIFEAMVAASPNLQTRKLGHVEDFCFRTIGNALGVWPEIAEMVRTRAEHEAILRRLSELDPRKSMPCPEKAQNETEPRR